jgi:hypothetical protein
MHDKENVNYNGFLSNYELVYIYIYIGTSTGLDACIFSYQTKALVNRLSSKHVHYIFESLSLASGSCWSGSNLHMNPACSLGHFWSPFSGVRYLSPGPSEPVGRREVYVSGRSLVHLQNSNSCRGFKTHTLTFIISLGVSGQYMLSVVQNVPYKRTVNIRYSRGQN